jgi:hypothetical protein
MPVIVWAALEPSDFSPGVSQRTLYGSLKMGLQKQSYFVYELHGSFVSEKQKAYTKTQAGLPVMPRFAKSVQLDFSRPAFKLS